MITLKYTRTFPISLLSHVDTLRIIQRVLRRAGVKVAFSQGFRPHMLLFMSPPLSLGIESECEYVSIDCTDDINGIEKRLNAFCPMGMRITDAFYTQSKPNLAAKITSALFEITAEGLGKALSVKNDRPVIIIEKDGSEKDVTDLIQSIDITDDNTVIVRLSYGNKTLKADKLLSYWVNLYSIDTSKGCSIKKLKMFVNEENVDAFLSRL
jgi:radical SAM-linked protein